MTNFQKPAVSRRPPSHSPRAAPLATALAALTLLLAAGCADDSFYPKTLVNKLRILGVRIVAEGDNDGLFGPELCPYSDAPCGSDTTWGNGRIALLAADENGVVFDGNAPDGRAFDQPFARPGYRLSWGLCDYSNAGAAPEVDCTRTPNTALTATTPAFLLPVLDVQGVLARVYRVTSGAAFDAALDEVGADSVDLFMGAAVEQEGNPDSRDWAVKRITASRRARDKMNYNPRLNEVRLGGVPFRYGERFAEVSTGGSYEITWTYPAEDRQLFETPTAIGLETAKEQIQIRAYTTAGAMFNNEGNMIEEADADIWRKSDIRVWWRPPFEVPPEGLEVTLIVILSDLRGGMQWTHGRVFVKRGASLLPL